MEISAVIIEDEKTNAERLNMLIEAHCPELSVKVLSHSVTDSVRAIKQYRPSIVFMDTELPVGNGYEILERTKDQHYKMIFTTAQRHYLLKAREQETVDYLVKPIDIDELIAVVKKVRSEINSRVQGFGVSIVGKQLQNKISIATSDGFIVLDTSGIIRAEADSNYTHLFFDKRNKITTAKTLKEIEEVLDPEIFLRTHQTHIINLNRVERYVKGDGGYVILSDGTSIPISRARKATFLAFFSRE
jgi:two-component system, LytTR family, response regulator